MSDLISRSALLQKFNDSGIQITFDLPVEEILGEDVDIDDFTMLVQDAIQAYKKMVIGTINEMQVAYSVEKVVAELEEEREYSYADFEEYVQEKRPCLDAEYDDYFHRGLERAVVIVKRGGVKENFSKTISSEKKTNFNRIREMTEEEMLDLLMGCICRGECLCNFYDNGCNARGNDSCESGVRKWLRQKRKERQPAEWKNSIMRHFTKIE